MYGLLMPWEVEKNYKGAIAVEIGAVETKIVKTFHVDCSVIPNAAICHSEQYTHYVRTPTTPLFVLRFNC